MEYNKDTMSNETQYDTVDLFDCLSPIQKKWGKIKGKSIAMIENLYYKIKNKNGE